MFDFFLNIKKLKSYWSKKLLKWQISHSNINWLLMVNKNILNYLNKKIYKYINLIINRWMRLQNAFKVFNCSFSFKIMEIKYLVNINNHSLNYRNLLPTYYLKETNFFFFFFYNTTFYCQSIYLSLKVLGSFVR